MLNRRVLDPAPASFSPSSAEGSAASFPADRTQADLPKRPASDGDGDGVILIGSGARIVGNIEHCKVVEIRGTLLGDVSADTFVVQESGVFQGSVEASNAQVLGSVEGKLRVADLLDIRATGIVSADATYGRLAVTAGGLLTGNVQKENQNNLSEAKNAFANGALGLSPGASNQ